MRGTYPLARLSQAGRPRARAGRYPGRPPTRSAVLGKRRRAGGAQTPRSRAHASRRAGGSANGGTAKAPGEKRVFGSLDPTRDRARQNLSVGVSSCRRTFPLSPVVLGARGVRGARIFLRSLVSFIVSPGRSAVGLCRDGRSLARKPFGCGVLKEGPRLLHSFGLAFLGRASIIPPMAKKNPHAVALGRRGARKGGLARAQKLDPTRRTEIARQAAVARWKRSEKPE